MPRSPSKTRLTRFSHSMHKMAALIPLMRFRMVPAILLGTLLLLGATDDSARVDRLGHKMICMCGCNQILLECNHLRCPSLTPMHAELVAAVDRGDADDAIVQSFVQEYGAVVLAAPTTRGFDRIAWIMPYAALVLGILLVAFVVRVWRNRPLPTHVGVPAPVAQAELERFRAQARKETDL